jgi:hypothetical protein
MFTITWWLFFPNTEKSAISFLVVGNQLTDHLTGRDFGDMPLEGARVMQTYR